MKSSLQIYFFFTIFWEFYGSSLSSGSLSCPMNMKSILIDKNSTEQVCDCEDTFWYHPRDDFCYEGYRQGPCSSGHYFVLSPGEPIAKCVKNPCRIDGLVPFEEKCYKLWDVGMPCKGYTFLGIDDDLQITCTDRSVLLDYHTSRVSKDCPDNSYLTPTDYEHSGYFCECKWTYIYSRKDNSCYQAYKQGPCAPGNYIVLPQGETEPRCEKNPCQEDGLVPFQNGCHKIYETGPPCVDIYTELTVNRTTFQLICFYYQFAPKIFGGGIINAPLKACPPGSRRVFDGCKKKFQ